MRFLHPSSQRRTRIDCCRRTSVAIRADGSIVRRKLNKNEETEDDRLAVVASPTEDFAEENFQNARETGWIDAVLDTNHLAHHVEELHVVQFRPI